MTQTGMTIEQFGQQQADAKLGQMLVAAERRAALAEAQASWLIGQLEELQKQLESQQAPVPDAVEVPDLTVGVEALRATEKVNIPVDNDDNDVDSNDVDSNDVDGNPA